MIIQFAPFELDVSGWQLRRDGKPVPLRPKTFAFLQYLAERPGMLVTKRTMLDAVWPDAAVTDDVLRLSARELRAALGDQATAPRFIETVPRLGYRFIATMGPAANARSVPVDDDRPTDRLVVGRASERAEIAAWLRAAIGGRRQLGFITGEAGIGKTTLVDVALRDFQRTLGTQVRIARGQCIEHYGGGEPYLPILQALGELRKGSDGAAIEDALRRYAPRWLVDSVARADTDSDAPVAGGGTHEHTLHMLAATLDALVEDTPLVLVLEDVHWSDYSTLDLLSVLARSRTSGRLLVLCTLRPVDAIVHGHPLTGVKRELLRNRACREILLGGLPAEDVARYLALRFSDAAIPAELLPLLVQRSDGNPFAVVSLVDHLLEHGMLVAGESGWEFHGDLDSMRTAIPDGLRAIVEPRLERLTADERRVLEIASAVGLEFSAHVVACAAPTGSDLRDVEVVEHVCDTLARRQELLRATGESISLAGTTSARYAFRHALYQQVLHQGLNPSQRRRLHQRIGEQMEARYAGRTQDVASALAAHFERSGDVERAVRYHGEAATQARWRFSYKETRLHVEAALRLTGDTETAEAMRRHVVMLDDLGWASVASRGWGDEEAARAFALMRELAERLDAAKARFNALEGELTVHTMRAEYAIARQRGEEMLLLAEQVGDPMAVSAALSSLGAAMLQLGELESAAEIGERGRALTDPPEPTLYTISCCSLIACSSALRGRVDRARTMNSECVDIAARGDVPLFRAYAAIYSAGVSMLMLDVATTRLLAEEAVRIAGDLGFAVVADTATIYRAWCDVQDGRVDEGVAALGTAFDAYLASGQRIGTSSHAVPVLVGYLAAGDVRRASALLDRVLAFIAETGERIVEPEIHRLKGECLLAGAAARGRKTDAIACFERAIALAEAQKSMLFELRATTSLYRVGPKATRARLARLVGRFAPEDDCVDVSAATALLGI